MSSYYASSKHTVTSTGGYCCVTAGVGKTAGQWNLYIPDTFGTTKTVQYKEVFISEVELYTFTCTPV